MDAKTKKEIYDLLCELKEDGKIFNMMNGPLYSSIYADKMADITYTLQQTYSVYVDFYQPCEGRVIFHNLDELINEYKCE
jgi:hypothetical protein